MSKKIIMKTTYTFLLFCFLLLAVQNTEAQNYIVEGTPTESDSFQTRATALNFLSSQNTPAIQNRNSVESSSIFIEQIGNDNVLNANTSSQTSDLNFSQRGNSNSIFLDISVADDIQQDILQQGNRNQFFNITTNPFGSHSAEVIQNGNNQDVTIYGNNSISDRIKINMQGDDRSVIVRSFN